MRRRDRPVTEELERFLTENARFTTQSEDGDNAATESEDAVDLEPAGGSAGRAEYCGDVALRSESGSGRAFSVIAWVALGSLCLIIVTGALVRLTGSGLGCVDWPRCNEQKLIDVSTLHARIEQINRLFTGLVSVSVIVAVLGAYRRRNMEPRLVWWAWSMVLGVVAQVVLGGLVVLTGLHPLANMGHFLLSMLLVTCAWVLVQLARRSDQEIHQSEPIVRKINDSTLSRLRWVLSLSALCAIVTGTVVTATGPHAGDEDAPRFGFELTSVARVHGITVLITVVLIVIILVKASQTHEVDDVRQLRDATAVLGWIAVCQAGIGYWQYFTGVPAGLVLVHIAGATTLWLGVCNVVIAPGKKSLVKSNS